MGFLIGLIVILASIAIFIILIYNKLVSKRQMVSNGWSDIDVQLKRRSELIPQLVKTVKAYAKHEKTLFADITERRSKAMAAGNDTAAREQAESALAAPLSRLIAVGEAYPELKANENYLDLQNELSDTENKIEMARRFYNGAVRELNTLVQSFPANLIAGLFGFGQHEYFNIDPRSAALPSVEL